MRATVRPTDREAAAIVRQYAERAPAGWLVFNTGALTMAIGEALAARDERLRAVEAEAEKERTAGRALLDEAERLRAGIGAEVGRCEERAHAWDEVHDRLFSFDETQAVVAGALHRVNDVMAERLRNLLTPAPHTTTTGDK